MDQIKKRLTMEFDVNEVRHHDNLELSAVEIVHEIRNPLATIKGFIQLLQPYLKEAGKEQYAEVVLSEINRTNDIIYEFLDAARRENNHVTNKISLNNIVKEVNIFFECEAILRNIQLITTLTDQEVTLSIPPNYLKQILINLVKNAMEAMVESPIRIVHISTYYNDEMVSIEVTDSGCGMTDEMIKNLFTPFYTTKEKGTGVGLSFCKERIEEYGGSIHVNSRIGKGSAFTILFPIIF